MEKERRTEEWKAHKAAKKKQLKQKYEKDFSQWLNLEKIKWDKEDKKKRKADIHNFRSYFLDGQKDEIFGANKTLSHVQPSPPAASQATDDTVDGAESQERK